jgi:pyruvate/2-oxoglutarate dehydrogenase complex dihydrolipoamide acyltransferase (E2) component
MNVRSLSRIDPMQSTDRFTEPQPIKMPTDLGQGKVLKWYKREGDVIKYDDIILDIDTEDFSFGLTHDEEDEVLIHQIVAQVDDVVKEGDVLCIVMRTKSKDEPDADKENKRDDDDESETTTSQKENANK